MNTLSLVKRIEAARAAWMACLILIVLGSEPAWAAYRSYTVKKNDSLSLIASQYRVSVVELARRNGLSLKDTIFPGQQLIIPSKSAASGSNSGLSSTVASAIRNARVPAGLWKYIVIHHSATPSATVKGMDEYHRNRRRMENGLAYHFVIGNGKGMKDGEVAVGNRWTRQLDGGHLASYSLNKVSLGICLVGNFDNQRPTARQMASMKALVQALQDRCNLKSSAVKTHMQMHPRHTQCPGRYFDSKRLIKELD